MKLTQIEYISACQRVHNYRYCYDRTVFTKVTGRITITCQTHGEFEQTARVHLQGSGCPICATAQRKQTMLSRYGATSYTSTAEFKEKTKQTVVNRYGVTKTIDIPGVVERQQQTRRDRYGVDYPLQNTTILKSTKDTLTQEYGVSSPGSHPDIRKKIENTNQHKYGSKSPLGNPDIQSKAKNTIQAKYGVDNINQLPCDVMDLLTNPDWLVAMNNTTSLIGIANQLGVSDVTVGNYFRKYSILPERHNTSSGEQQVSAFLSEHFDVVTSDRQLIPPFELDVVIPTHKVAIEFCGLYWHCETNRPNPLYHQKKMQMCNAAGYRLITMFEDEWYSKQDLVKQKILHICGQQTHRVGARSCGIQELTTQDKNTFLNKTHIQGTSRSTCCYGLIHNDEIVAAMAWVLRGSGEWELVRYASLIVIPGGFTKLLRHFLRTYHPTKVITFADLRWSEGSLYKDTGWVVEKNISPDYYWVKQTMREHKFNFRHSRLAKRFDAYNPNLTEVQNCHAHGWRRIYDCGKIKYRFPLGEPPKAC